MNKTDEWLTIETLIAGLSEMARDIKEMEDNSSHMSDERCKQAANELQTAANNSNAEQVEQIVENNPAEVAEILPDDTPLNTEAEQAIDGGKDAEVDNDAVQDFLGGYKHGLLNSMDEYYNNKNKKLSRAEKKQIAQESQDELDRMTLQDARDMAEEFDIPSPYTPEQTNGEIYGDDYKALAPTQGNNLQYDKPDTDLSTYVVPSYTVEGEGIEPITEGKYEITELDRQPAGDNIPNEETEDVELDPEKHDKGFYLPTGANHSVDSIGGSSNAGSAFKGDYSSNGSMGFGGGKGIMSGSGGIGSFMARPKAEKPVENKVEEVKPAVSKAPSPVETEAKATAPSVKANPTTSNRISNGGFNSGSVNKKGNSLIKVSSNKITEGTTEHTQDYSGTLETEDLSEAALTNLEMRIRALDGNTANSLGFEVGETIKYNGSPLDKLDGGTINSLEEILDSIGA